ncbi:MAG: VOC family protein [Thermoflexaceae bacterium]|nr:VOC family protein [Thermoflexaceae bacterium]
MSNPIRLCLWFDSQAEEAAAFYTGIFRDSKMGAITRYPAAGREMHGREPGSVMTVAFELNGQAFLALNGGPLFTFSEAVSLEVLCDDQAGIDYYWDRLSEGGDPAAQQCGWLKDRFGLSWQIAPRAWEDLVGGADTARAERVYAAMFQMKKLDIAGLERAARG